MIYRMSLSSYASQHVCYWTCSARPVRIEVPRTNSGLAVLLQAVVLQPHASPGQQIIGPIMSTALAMVCVSEISL